jgi:hypothetical protein
MKKYKIEVKETLSRIIEVDASSQEEAYSKVKDLYQAEEIVLDADDFVEAEFEVINDLSTNLAQ